MGRYRLSAEAVHDLDSISDYILEDNPGRAVSFVQEITAKFEAIAERPLSFPTSDDLPPNVRSALHGNYRVIFRMSGTMAEILRVLHGARDISRLL